jgi:hypothetical protein
MGASFIQGFWLSRLFLLQFFSLGVVRESECFLTVEYLMGSDRLYLLQGRAGTQGNIDPFHKALNTTIITFNTVISMV